MNSKNRKFKLKMIKLQQEMNRKKQQNYNNRFSIVEKKKQYDALQDPHASYYFVNRSVRNHLKHIKNATLNQTTNSVQKQRLKKLFSQKIKYKPKQILTINHGVYELQQLLTNQVFRKSSIKSVHSQRNRSVRKFSEMPGKKNLLQNERQGSLSKKNFKDSLKSEELKGAKSVENEEQIFGNKSFSKQRTVENNIRTIDAILGVQFRQSQQNRANGSKKVNQKQRYQKQHEKQHKKFLNFIEQRKKKLVLKLQA